MRVCGDAQRVRLAQRCTRRIRAVRTWDTRRRVRESSVRRGVWKGGLLRTPGRSAHIVSAKIHGYAPRMNFREVFECSEK